MIKLGAENVEGGSKADCGHFVAEEGPDETVRWVFALMDRTIVGESNLSLISPQKFKMIP
jgi:hypothetical protein